MIKGSSTPSTVQIPAQTRPPSLQIVSNNLSTAWWEALAMMARPGVHSIEPLIVTVTDFDEDSRPYEVEGTSDLIDAVLRSKSKRRASSRSDRGGLPSVATTASTLFPEALWRRDRSRSEFFQNYLGMLPRLRKFPPNRRGLYFERMIDFGRGPSGGNQLENAISLFKSGVKRTSAFQIAIADPERDFTREPRQGFPCLQQLALHPSRKTGELAVTAFYGTQYLVGRAYGNYIGLCRLGRFLAREMGLRLSRVTCVASYAPVEGGFGKTVMAQLLAEHARISIND
jgi:hypothetical protein